MGWRQHHARRAGLALAGRGRGPRTGTGVLQSILRLGGAVGPRPLLAPNARPLSAWTGAFHPVSRPPRHRGSAPSSLQRRRCKAASRLLGAGGPCLHRFEGRPVAAHAPVAGGGWGRAVRDQGGGWHRAAAPRLGPNANARGADLRVPVMRATPAPGPSPRPPGGPVATGHTRDAHSAHGTRRAARRPVSAGGAASVPFLLGAQVAGPRSSYTAAQG